MFIQTFPNHLQSQVPRQTRCNIKVQSGKKMRLSRGRTTGGRSEKGHKQAQQTYLADPKGQHSNINRLGEDVGTNVIVFQPLDDKIRGEVGAISCVSPSPHVSKSHTLLLLSTTTEPKSPLAENGPDLELQGRTVISLDITSGLPSEYVLSRPTVRSVALLFFNTMMTSSLTWSSVFSGSADTSPCRIRFQKSEGAGHQGTRRSLGWCGTGTSRP